MLWLLWLRFVQIMHDLPDMVVTKGGALVVCSLIDRLVSGGTCTTSCGRDGEAGVTCTASRNSVHR